MPVTSSHSTTIPLAHARTAWMTITRTLLSRSQCHLRHIPSDRLSSDIDSLNKKAINAVNSETPHTILLVGDIRVGKTSVLEFIANVLAGNDIDHYDLDILGHTNERGGSDHHSQTTPARMYKLTSKNGKVVSTGAFGRLGCCITSSQGSPPRHAWVRQHWRHPARRATQEHCDSDQGTHRLPHFRYRPRQWDHPGRHC